MLEHVREAVKRSEGPRHDRHVGSGALARCRHPEHIVGVSEDVVVELVAPKKVTFARGGRSSDQNTGVAPGADVDDGDAGRRRGHRCRESVGRVVGVTDPSSTSRSKPGFRVHEPRRTCRRLRCAIASCRPPDRSDGQWTDDAPRRSSSTRGTSPRWSSRARSLSGCPRPRLPHRARAPAVAGRGRERCPPAAAGHRTAVHRVRRAMCRCPQGSCSTRVRSWAWSMTASSRAKSTSSRSASKAMFSARVASRR